MNAAVSVVTLGVRDFARAKRFYAEGLGWTITQELGEWVAFALEGGATVLCLFPWDEFAADAGVPANGSGFRGVSLAYNVRSEPRVDEVMAEAEAAGARIVQPPRTTEWGGYSGYFADPEGHLWEVATGATQIPFAE